MAGKVSVRCGDASSAEHVGADGIEGDVAQVEQAGVADHDVQAQRQQHVQQRDVDDAHPDVAGVLRDSSGSTSSAQRGEQEDDRACSSWCLGSSGPVGDALAEQARRPQRQHEDQHDEGEDVAYWLPSTPPVSAPM